MAYDFIGLVNDVNRRLNEVEVSSTDFPDAVGFYSFAKDAVNHSIRHINQEEFNWPWNFVEEDTILNAGQMRYDFPFDAKTVDFNTFRIRRSSSLGVDTQKLKIMSYEEYLERHIDDEYNSNATNIRGVPKTIIRSPNREFIVHPSPDKAYRLIFEYYATGYELQLFTDAPTLPEQYRYVIIDGAMYYVYHFRGDMGAANNALQRFEQGIKHLRTLHINRPDYLRDTRVHF
tara:strand:+ start:6470 stop:7162 length:693 start_codon:yes stop_codon:yes gene_type:complete